MTDGTERVLTVRDRCDMTSDEAGNDLDQEAGERRRSDGACDRVDRQLFHIVTHETARRISG
jgi:hypothetical protein